MLCVWKKNIFTESEKINSGNFNFPEKLFLEKYFFKISNFFMKIEFFLNIFEKIIIFGFYNFNYHTCKIV
jgi:hypothetical protein